MTLRTALLIAAIELALVGAYAAIIVGSIP